MPIANSLHSRDFLTKGSRQKNAALIWVFPIGGGGGYLKLIQKKNGALVTKKF